MRHIRTVNKGISDLRTCGKKELAQSAHEMRVPVSLVEKVVELGRLPVVNFAAGGIATPSDAALCMQLGCDGVFVGSGIFKSSDPERRAQAIVDAVAHYNDPKKIAEVSSGLGKPMDSLDVSKLLPEEKLSRRGI
ncbi:Pyridoxal 5'-phosphate synthase subunit PdxS [uncultured archaeon]|nr:Pyridoxal 5'-phosphate synthase subunit PdxS [uncultured archaeon]